MVPIDAAVLYLWGTTREYQQQDEELYKSVGISIQDVAAAQTEVESPRIVPANVFRAARSGVEAVLELFYLSPYSTFTAARKKKVPDFEPIIRIQLPGPVLTGILRRVDSMMPELRSRLKNLIPDITQVVKVQG